MDKLQLVIEYTRNMLKSGHLPKDVNPSSIYDLVDMIEELGIDRGIITETVCNFCREKVSFIDTSTGGDRSVVAHCHCRRGKGISKIMALRDWRMQPEGVNRGY